MERLPEKRSLCCGSAQYRSPRKSYPHFSYNRNCEKVFCLAPGLNYFGAHFSRAKTKRKNALEWINGGGGGGEELPEAVEMKLH